MRTLSLTSTFYLRWKWMFPRPGWACRHADITGMDYQTIQRHDGVASVFVLSCGAADAALPSCKGLSFISNRQRRYEGTFSASELAGIEPTPPAPKGAGYVRLDHSATVGILYHNE